MKNDIQTREDIAKLVDEFYDRVLRDELLAPHFSHIDFEKHKPRMVHFWSFVLLDEPGYTTNVFDRHRHLDIDHRHFERWLQLFESTLNELFEGERADTALLRAKTIGWTFQEKLKQLRKH